MTLLSGAFAGFIGGVLLSLLVLIGQVVNLRNMFVNANQQLFDILTFGMGVPQGLLVLLLVSFIIGAVAAGVFLLPHRLRNAIVMAFAWVLVIGLLRDLILTVVNQWGIKAKTFPALASTLVTSVSAYVNSKVFAASGLRPAQRDRNFYSDLRSDLLAFGKRGPANAEEAQKKGRSLGRELVQKVS